jgi:hypothetical protein
MKYTEHLVFAALLIPTAAVLIAAALSLAVSKPEAPREVIALYTELHHQP